VIFLSKLINQTIHTIKFKECKKKSIDEEDFFLKEAQKDSQ
jgi:hypothetical protein